MIIMGELHWYEAHGIGKKEFKRKRYLRLAREGRPRSGAGSRSESRTKATKRRSSATKSTPFCPTWRRNGTATSAWSMKAVRTTWSPRIVSWPSKCLPPFELHFGKLHGHETVSAVSKMSPRTGSIREDWRGIQRTRALLLSSTLSTGCDHNSHTVR